VPIKISKFEKSFRMNFAYIFLGMVGPWQIAILVLVVLLLFGGKKIPELMKGLGSGIKEFKDATKEDPEKEAEKKSENKIDNP
jgi:sec-independent protein translocase protein TatA